MRTERLAEVLIALSALLFLYLSASSLYYLPVADSYRWYGDETWLMLAWKNLLMTGKMSVPIALGSTLQQSSGLLTGSAWLSAIFYGIPQLLLQRDFDVVSIGRTVTFIFSLVTIGWMFWTGRKFQAAGLASLFSILLLITTPSFTFASHSARYDVLTGLILLLYVTFFVLRSHEQKVGSWTFWFLTGLVTSVLSVVVSPHLLVLLLPVALYIMFRAIGRDRKLLLAAIGGLAAGVVAVVLSYWWGQQEFALIGTTRYGNQFASVLANIPVRRLFSFSAQRHQLWAKGYYLWTEAPVFLFLLPALFISEVTLRRGSESRGPRSYVTICTGIVILSWLIFQGTLPYYLAHVLPLITMATGLHLSEWYKRSEPRTIPSTLILAASCAILYFGFPSLMQAKRYGRMLTIANSAAVQSAVEHASLAWGSDTVQPLILTQGPAVHELLRDRSVRLMSESFLFFPMDTAHPAEVISRARVNYILDYRRPMTPQYQQAVDSLGVPVFSRTAFLLDRSCDYFGSGKLEPDTLTLYKVMQ